MNKFTVVFRRRFTSTDIGGQVSSSACISTMLSKFAASTDCKTFGKEPGRDLQYDLQKERRLKQVRKTLHIADFGLKTYFDDKENRLFKVTKNIQNIKFYSNTIPSRRVEKQAVGGLLFLDLKILWSVNDSFWPKMGQFFHYYNNYFTLFYV